MTSARERAVALCKHLGTYECAEHGQPGCVEDALLEAEAEGWKRGMEEAAKMIENWWATDNTDEINVCPEFAEIIRKVAIEKKERAE